jgi:hypothetical protein
MRFSARLSANALGRLVPLVAACALAAGCGDDSGGAAPAPGAHSDEVPESRVSGSEIAQSYGLEGSHYVSPVLDAPLLASRVGAMFDVAGATPGMDVAIEARGIGEDGKAGPWVPMELTWEEGELRVAKADLGSLSAGAQIRVPADLAPSVEELTFSAVIPEDAPLDNAKIQGALPEYLSGAGVRSRAEWGARQTKCTGLDGGKKRFAVHHTVTMRAPVGGDYAARLRQIQSFHMDTRGWCDVGYTFLVTEDGTVWEGRPMRFVGAHVANHNTGNIGMSFVGCYNPSGCGGLGDTTPSAAMVEGAAEVIGLLAKQHGIAVSGTSLLGHRDHAGAQTSCPGDNLHKRLGDIRAIAAGVASGAPVCKSAFSDICGSPFEKDIIWLAEQGITSGCGADTFCPDKIISRAQMAQFLTVALKLPPGPDAFTDDDGSIFEPAINSIAAAGITSGCSPDGKQFCPTQEVSRGQMAQFMAKGFKLPASSTNAFGDDDGTLFEEAINALSAAGITSGCNPEGTNFCPNNKVTRAHMASFLHRAMTP